jgi:signal transduction histidine kinase
VVKLQAEIEVAGQRTPYLLSAHVLREAQDSTGVMVAAVDLGRLSRLASRLAYSQKLATLGELTSGVAHEIKNPLHAMVMHIALMRRKLREDTPPEITRHLDVLDEEIRRLDRVVQGFLQFSRPEELRLTVLDLGHVLRTCVDQVRDRAEASRIGVELAGADAEIPVWGEEDLLRQAFSNLLGNAVEAMPEGGRLRVSSERQNGWARVRIEDSGVGIAESELPHVFRLYYTTKTGGSGIGLAVVHRVVELHGGNLSIESRPGQGTAVTVALPGDTS